METRVPIPLTRLSAELIDLEGATAPLPLVFLNAGGSAVIGPSPQRPTDDIARRRRGRRGGGSVPRAVRRTEVPVDSVREHLASSLEGMEAALEAVPRALSAFRGEEVTLTLEVLATGKVSLVGTGAEVTGKGGLTLLLRRED